MTPRSYRADPIVAVATAIGEPAPRARSSRAGTPDEANTHFTSETSNFPSRAKPLTAPRPVTPSNQVTDDEYAKIVNKRRQEYGGFIVGEDGDE